MLYCFQRFYNTTLESTDQLVNTRNIKLDYSKNLNRFLSATNIFL